MRSIHRFRAASVIGAALPAVVIATPVSATSWQTGQHMFGGVSIEPAVDMATGNQIFLLTPVGAKTNANPRAHAPLYLVLYPNQSTIDASILNCQPFNCDHVNTFPPYGGPDGSYKGHDHLVGLPHTGDWNVAWDVYPIVFTPRGFADGAINTRILTETQLNAAIAAGDAVMGPIVLSFNCSKVSGATYMHGTPFHT
jgi:hypothetical protein